MHTHSTHCLFTLVFSSNITDTRKIRLRQFKEYQGTHCYKCVSEVKGECRGLKAHCKRGKNDLNEMVPVYGCFKGTSGSPIGYSKYRVYPMS